MLQVTTAAAPIAATIAELYARFEQAHAAYAAIADPEEKRWERALNRCNAAADRVVAAPAKTPAEILLKIRAGLWRCGEITYEQLADLELAAVEKRSFKRDPFLALVTTICVDLRRARDAQAAALDAAPFA
jgi:hypothetical protein